MPMILVKNTVLNNTAAYTEKQTTLSYPGMLQWKGNVLQQLTLALKGLQAGCRSCRGHLGLQTPQLLP